MIDNIMQKIRKAGIMPVLGISFVFDGKIHRFDTVGKEGGNNNGWYVLHGSPDNYHGAAGDWHTGVKVSLVHKNNDRFRYGSKQRGHR